VIKKNPNGNKDIFFNIFYMFKNIFSFTDVILLTVLFSIIDVIITNIMQMSFVLYKFIISTYFILQIFGKYLSLYARFYKMQYVQ